MKNLTIYILAGGKSSRMGEDKGLMLINGKSMIKYLLETVKLISNNIIIISNNLEYEQFGYKVFPDVYKDKGPVGGIYTALQNSKTESNLILSCDTPFVSTELLKIIIENGNRVDVCIPSHAGQNHPLLGLYKTKVKTEFKKSLLSNHLKLINIIETLDFKVIDLTNKIKKKAFYNLNSVKDIRDLI